MEILKTKKNSPPRILIHGGAGLGKSSLAAAAPNPIFIQTENGLENIDTTSFALCTTFDMVIEQLSWVYAEEHDFQTVVIDSIDWLEKLIAAHVCKMANKASISDFAYGAGFQAMFEQLDRVIRALNAIRDERKMAVILIAHSQIKTYNNPLGSDFDMHCIKLREKNAEMFIEFCDLVGFIHFSVFTKAKKDGFSESVKAVGGTERVLSCAPHAAYVSKNHYNITTDINLPSASEGWANLITAIKGA